MSEQRNSFSKRMQVVSYFATTLSLWGVIPALGYVNKTLDLHISNEVIMLGFGGILGLWIDLTKKINRVTSNGAKVGE
jgi:hypothetical protein